MNDTKMQIEPSAMLKCKITNQRQMVAIQISADAVSAAKMKITFRRSEEKFESDNETKDNRNKQLKK